MVLGFFFEAHSFLAIADVVVVLGQPRVAICKVEMEFRIKVMTSRWIDHPAKDVDPGHIES